MQGPGETPVWNISSFCIVHLQMPGCTDADASASPRDWQEQSSESSSLAHLDHFAVTPR